MSDLLEYKGYHGTIEYSAEDGILCGSVHSCIDNYLSLCAQFGKQPEKEFKGCFNVRIAQELHRAAALAAAKESFSLNQWISEAFRERTRKVASYQQSRA